MKTPTSVQEWLKVAEEFEVKWNYPCCLGSIDGKHIAIKQPDCSGSEYFNYKHFFSVLLLALVDANYKFIYIDVGASGRAGDAVVFADSSLKKALDDGSLDVPPPKGLEGIEQSKLDYHIIGDDAFPLTKTLMKPYPHRNLDKTMRIFNYRLSRSRRVVENAFGILSNRFRVFLTTINLSPDKVRNLVLAACCLHNYLGEKNKHSYLGACDVEDSTSHLFTNCIWRNDPTLVGLVPGTDRNPTKNAKEQRRLLTNYFSDKGTVPWQEQMI